jgi:hypothetical protein
MPHPHAVGTNVVHEDAGKKSFGTVVSFAHFTNGTLYYEIAFPPNTFPNQPEEFKLCPCPANTVKLVPPLFGKKFPTEICKSHDLPQNRTSPRLQNAASSSKDAAQGRQFASPSASKPSSITQQSESNESDG